MLNSLANDDRNWGGDVNGGGHKLSNVILSGSGGFQYIPSPAEITPGADGQSVTQLDQTVSGQQIARWKVGKDSIAESGGNSGSNFVIARYDDAGSYLGAAIQINRASGLITMGQQRWSASVDGNGQTLSNVVIPGMLSDPTTTKGDLLVRSASALTRLAVATDGWVLTLDSAAPNGLGVKWAAPVGTVSSVFGRQGAVVAQAGDYTAAQVGAVGTATQVIAGTGLSGGGPLTASVTLNGVPMGASGGSHATGMVPDPGAAAGATRYLREDATWAIPSGAGGGMTDPTTTKGDLIVRGTSATTRLGVGTDGQILVADSTQTLGVKWGAAPAGGYWVAGAAGAIYYNGGNVGIGNDMSVLPTGGTTGARLVVGKTTPAGSLIGELDLVGNINSAPGTVGSIGFANYNLAATDKRIAAINANTDGSLDSGALIFYTWNAGAVGERIRITPAGNVGIGLTSPNARLTIVGTAQTDASLTYNAADVFQVAATSPGVALAMGNMIASPNAFWMQVRSSNANGNAYALALNPLGGNVGVATSNPLCVLSTGTALKPIKVSSYDGGGLAYGMGVASGQLTFGASIDPNTGTPQMVLTSGGKVGIATTSPSAMLDVLTTLTGQATFESQWWSTNNPQYVLKLETIWDGAGIRHHFVERQAGTDSLVMVFNGPNVGIATATTPARLTVLGPSIDPTLSGYGIVAVQGSVGTELEIGAMLSSPYCLYLQGRHSSAAAAYPLLLNPVGGNVAIGTTGNPAQLLHLGNNGAGVGIRFAVPSLNWDLLAGTGNINFANGNGQVFTVASNGSLGIGTSKTSPSYAIDAAGDINCTGAFRVNGTALSAANVTNAVSTAGSYADPAWITSLAWGKITGAPAGGSGYTQIQINGGGVVSRAIINFINGSSTIAQGGDDPANVRTTVYFSTSSDARLKRNVVDLVGGIPIIEQLRPVEFEWNGLAGFREGLRAVAVIAQELREVLPKCVYSLPTKLHPGVDDEEADILYYEPNEILFQLVLAVQQLSSKVRQLEGRT